MLFCIVYLTTMMADSPTRCLECTKIIKRKEVIRCQNCRRQIHFKCAKVKACDKVHILNNPNYQYYCEYCLHYKCGKCDKPVYNDNNSLQCEAGCMKWYHLRCTNISLAQYNEFNSAQTSLPWYCTNCHSEPFRNVNDNELFNLFHENHLEIFTIEQTNIKMYDLTCSICSRKIHTNKASKGLPCNSCSCLVHRKCSGLSNYEINHLKPADLVHWECMNCRCDKFACTPITDEELISHSFNSNFDCTCQTTCEARPFKLNIVFDLTRYRIRIRIRIM